METIFITLLAFLNVVLLVTKHLYESAAREDATRREAQLIKLLASQQKMLVAKDFTTYVALEGIGEPARPELLTEDTFEVSPIGSMHY